MIAITRGALDRNSQTLEDKELILTEVYVGGYYGSVELRVSKDGTWYVAQTKQNGVTAFYASGSLQERG